VPASLAIISALLLYMTLPGKLTIGPGWVIPALEGALLIPLTVRAPIAVLFIVGVDWRAVAHATFLPELRSDRSYVAALIAVFGTTISPYLFFWQSSEEVEEEHGREDAVDQPHLRAMRVDVFSGMVSAVLVMFAIQVAAAVTLGAHGATTIQTADLAARALEPLAGRLASLSSPRRSSAPVPWPYRCSRDRPPTCSPRPSGGEGLWRTLRSAPGF
jgi:Mn2+/Fe2+ NRAMP family transporter